MTTTTDLIKSITRAKYRVQPEQLTALAREHYDHSTGVTDLQGTYLRVLVAAVKATTGAGDGKKEVLETIDSIHAEYMPHLEAGVLTPDIMPDERRPKEEQERRTREKHRRPTFARSSKSELRSYVNLGGDLKDLEPGTVTRGTLREFIKSQRNPGIELPEGMSAETKLGKTLELRAVGGFGTVIEQIEKLAKIEEEDPEVIVNLIQAMQDRLTELADSVGMQLSTASRIKQLAVKHGERRGDMKLWPSHH